MKETRILGIHINNRVSDATKVQETLTTYGCSIKTRLGLHEVVNEYCSTTGLILLELTGDVNESIKLENALLAIEGMDVQKMVFRE
ncbi:MAG: hypothetical protein FJY10_08110 [Bacteroidetes bacterium]|nr:hypothetical protein [Bacteroidota bacterium]